jgi:hypothetical protein
MPEEQRLKEDLELAKKSRESKPKGNGIFLQKYWHKGAFFQVRRFGMTTQYWALIVNLAGLGSSQTSRLLCSCRVAS